MTTNAVKNAVKTNTAPDEMFRRHQSGLRGEIEMWSHCGRDYWWQDGDLWVAIAKPRVEAFPPSAEALRAGRQVVIGLVVFDGVVLAILVRFGFWVFGGA